MGPTHFLTAKIAFKFPQTQRTFYSNRTPSLVPSTIILDWDDTLMCTSFLLSRNKILSEEETSLIKALGCSVGDLLSLCKKNGTVYILTNSSKAWVLSTATNYLALDQDILEGIFIFSARDKYEETYPKEKWKELAYHEMENLIKDSKSFLCIGDSKRDIEEGKKLKRKYENATVATIKFITMPMTPQEIMKEIRIVIENFKKLNNSNYNFYFDNRGKGGMIKGEC